MSQTARLAMVSRPHPNFSIVEQCALLRMPRSTLYYKPKPVSDDDLTLMRRIDEIYMKWPFYGSRRMVEELRGERWDVNRKRVRRLMRLMGIEAIYQKPNSSRKHPAHKIYAYLVRNLDIDHANHVWCADITYIPMAKDFAYLVAVMDWFSRRVLAWRLSITLEVDFCVEALQEAMDRYGKPKIFNTDQGSQFTSCDFTDLLAKKRNRDQHRWQRPISGQHLHRAALAQPEIRRNFLEGLRLGRRRTAWHQCLDEILQ
jgi:putative transposase